MKIYLKFKIFKIHIELFPPDLSRVLQNIGDKLSESETEVRSFYEVIILYYEKYLFQEFLNGNVWFTYW